MFELSTILAMLVSILTPAVLPTDPYSSPAGKYAVVFDKIAQRTFSGEEQLRALDNVDHVEYEVAVLRRDTLAQVASVRYVDVYGFNQPRNPTPVNRINGWFTWSPDEDFVVVPDEGWASAPGTAERRVVAVSDRLDWSESWMTLDNMTWTDSLRAVGDRHNDCDYSVDLFDGETGTQRAIVEAVSPIGYRIASVAGRTMLLQRVLDNCSSDEQRATFEDRCLSLDLDSFTLIDTPCP